MASSRSTRSSRSSDIKIILAAYDAYGPGGLDTLVAAFKKDCKCWESANEKMLEDSSSSFGLPNLMHLDAEDGDGKLRKIFAAYLSTNHLVPIPKKVLCYVPLRGCKVPVCVIDFFQLKPKVEYSNSVACELPAYENLNKCAKRARATSSTIMNFVSGFYTSKDDRDSDFKTGSWDHGLEMGHCFHSLCGMHAPTVNMPANLIMEPRQLNQFDEKCMQMIRPQMKGKGMDFQHKFVMIFEQQAEAFKGSKEFLVPHVNKKTLTLLVKATAKDGTEDDEGLCAHLYSIEIAKDFCWKIYNDSKVENLQNLQNQERNVRHLRRAVLQDMKLVLRDPLERIGQMTTDEMRKFVKARHEELKKGKRHRLRMQVRPGKYCRGTTNPQLQDGQNPGPKNQYYELNNAVMLKFGDDFKLTNLKDPDKKKIYGWGRGSTIVALQPCPPGTDLKTHITSILGAEWGRKQPQEIYEIQRMPLEELQKKLSMGKDLQGLQGLSFTIECVEGCPWTLVINKLETSEKSIKVENAMILGNKLGLVLSGTMTFQGESPSFSLKASLPECSISFGDICKVFGLYSKDSLPVEDLLTIEKPSMFMASEGEWYDCKETGIRMMGPLFGGSAIFTVNVPDLFKWSGEAGFIYQTHSVIVEAEDKKAVNPLMMKSKILLVSLRPHVVALHFPESAPLTINIPLLGEVKVAAASLAIGVCSFAGITMSSLQGVLVDFVSFDIKHKEFSIEIATTRDLRTCELPSFIQKVLPRLQLKQGSFFHIALGQNFSCSASCLIGAGSVEVTIDGNETVLTGEMTLGDAVGTCNEALDSRRSHLLLQKAAGTGDVPNLAASCTISCRDKKVHGLEAELVLDDVAVPNMVHFVMTLVPKLLPGLPLNPQLVEAVEGFFAEVSLRVRLRYTKDGERQGWQSNFVAAVEVNGLPPVPLPNLGASVKVARIKLACFGLSKFKLQTLDVKLATSLYEPLQEALAKIGDLCASTNGLASNVSTLVSRTRTYISIGTSVDYLLKAARLARFFLCKALSLIPQVKPAAEAINQTMKVMEKAVAKFARALRKLKRVQKAGEKGQRFCDKVSDKMQRSKSILGEVSRRIEPLPEDCAHDEANGSKYIKPLFEGSKWLAQELNTIVGQASNLTSDLSQCIPELQAAEDLKRELRNMADTMVGWAKDLLAELQLGLNQNRCKVEVERIETEAGVSYSVRHERWQTLLEFVLEKSDEVCEFIWGCLKPILKPILDKIENLVTDLLKKHVPIDFAVLKKGLKPLGLKVGKKALSVAATGLKKFATGLPCVPAASAECDGSGDASEGPAMQELWWKLDRSNPLQPFSMEQDSDGEEGDDNKLGGNTMFECSPKCKELALPPASVAAIPRIETERLSDLWDLIVNHLGECKDAPQDVVARIAELDESVSYSADAADVAMQQAQLCKIICKWRLDPILQRILLLIVYFSVRLATETDEGLEGWTLAHVEEILDALPAGPSLSTVTAIILSLLKIPDFESKQKVLQWCCQEQNKEELLIAVQHTVDEQALPRNLYILLSLGAGTLESQRAILAVYQDHFAQNAQGEVIPHEWWSLLRQLILEPHPGKDEDLERDAETAAGRETWSPLHETRKGSNELVRQPDCKSLASFLLHAYMHKGCTDDAKDCVRRKTSEAFGRSPRPIAELVNLADSTSAFLARMADTKQAVQKLQYLIGLMTPASLRCGRRLFESHRLALEHFQIMDLKECLEKRLKPGMAIEMSQAWHGFYTTLFNSPAAEGLVPIWKKADARSQSQSLWKMVNDARLYEERSTVVMSQVPTNQRLRELLIDDDESVAEFEPSAEGPDTPQLEKEEVAGDDDSQLQMALQMSMQSIQDGNARMPQQVAFLEDGNARMPQQAAFPQDGLKLVIGLLMSMQDGNARMPAQEL